VEALSVCNFCSFFFIVTPCKSSRLEVARLKRDFRVHTKGAGDKSRPNISTGPRHFAFRTPIDKEHTSFALVFARVACRIIKCGERLSCALHPNCVNSRSQQVAANIYLRAAEGRELQFKFESRHSCQQKVARAGRGYFDSA
jgi:hypothetical protein